MQFEISGTRKALLIVDVQELFTTVEAPFNNLDAGPMIAGINCLAKTCRDADIPVIVSSFSINKDRSDAGLLDRIPLVKEGHLCSDGPLIGADPRLLVADSDVILERNRPSAFWGDKLEGVLHSMHIETLLLAGLSINNAISSTARDAHSRDIQVLIAKETVGTTPWEPNTAIYLETLDNWFAEVTDLEHLIKRIGD